MNNRLKSGPVGQRVAYKKVSQSVDYIKHLFLITLGSMIVTFAGYLILKIPGDKFLYIPEYFAYSLAYDVFHDNKYLTTIATDKAVILSYESVFWQGVILSVVIGVAAFSLALYFFRRSSQNSEQEHHLRGASLSSIKELNKQLIKSSKMPFLNGYFIGEKNKEIQIPEEYLWRSFAIAGRPGTGKSTLIKHLLTQDRKRENVKAFIIDINGEYWRRFGDPSKDIILGFNYPQSSRWNFWNESVSMNLLASYLVPDLPYSNAFFNQAARIYVTSLLQRHQSLEAMLEELQTSNKEVIQRVQEEGGLAAKVFGKEGSDQSAGVFASAILQFSFLEEFVATQKKVSGTKPFSILDWCQNKDTSWVFVAVKDDDLPAAKSLIATWFNLAIHGCLMRDEDRCYKGDYPSIRFVLDELKSIGKLQEFEKGDERLRKHRGTIITGYQNNSQLEDVYGRNGAKNLKDILQNKIVYSVGEPEACEELSRYFGDHEVEELSEQHSYGSKQDSFSISRRSVNKRVLLASEISALKDGECFVKIGPFNPVKANIPLISTPARLEPLVYERPLRESTKINPSLEDIGAILRQNPRDFVSMNLGSDQQLTLR